jgi:short-subunit dehydrogenase
MATRDPSKILFTSSIGSTIPGAFQAVYNASQSFLHSFAEALQTSSRTPGIAITSPMPGPPETTDYLITDRADSQRRPFTSIHAAPQPQWPGPLRWASVLRVEAHDFHR